MFLGIEDANKVITVLDKVLFAPTKWQDLGLKLGLYMPRLRVFEQKGNAYDHLKMTIEAWLSGEDNVTSRTWKTLVEAVKETGDKAAAEKLPKKLKSLYNITI